MTTRICVSPPRRWSTTSFVLMAVTWLMVVSSTAYAFVIDPPPGVTSSTTIEGATGQRRRRQGSTSTRLGLFDMLNAGKKALVKQMAGEYDQAAIRARLDSLIQDNPVLFLNFETCPYCVKAKAILDEKKCRYMDVDLQKDPDGKAIRAELGERVGRTSVPAIWINQQFIGGCNDGPMGGIVTLQNNGQLDAMLQKAGTL